MSGSGMRRMAAAIVIAALSTLAGAAEASHLPREHQFADFECRRLLHASSTGRRYGLTALHVGLRAVARNALAQISEPSSLLGRGHAFDFFDDHRFGCGDFWITPRGHDVGARPGEVIRAPSRRSNRLAPNENLIG
jgi:hypothetical protein